MEFSISAFSHPNFTGQNFGTKGIDRGLGTNRMQEAFIQIIASQNKKTKAFQPLTMMTTTAKTFNAFISSHGATITCSQQ
jgi:hypothetical protein